MTEHNQLIDAVNVRITTRHYDQKDLDPNIIRQVESTLDAINTLSGLNIQLILNKPNVFAEVNASGHLSNAANYFALVGPKDDPEHMEMAGFYGQRVVLTATLYGLGTGWIAGSWDKEAARKHCQVKPGQDLYLGISTGYSREEADYGNRDFDELCHRQATHRSSKSYQELTKTMSDAERDQAPEWFKRGVEAAGKAPSAMNSQPILFSWNSESGAASASLDPEAGHGSLIDLGIAKMNFQIGVGGGKWLWGDGGHFARS